MGPDKNDTQLARLVYHKVLAIMKFTLDLEEQKYPERGRQDDRYKFFRKQLMHQTYENLRSLFGDLEKLGIIESADYEEDVKDGYKPTASGGSGYLNTSSFDAWLNE